MTVSSSCYLADTVVLLLSVTGLFVINLGDEGTEMSNPHVSELDCVICRFDDFALSCAVISAFLERARHDQHGSLAAQRAAFPCFFYQVSPGGEGG